MIPYFFVINSKQNVSFIHFNENRETIFCIIQILNEICRSWNVSILLFLVVQGDNILWLQNNNFDLFLSLNDNKILSIWQFYLNLVHILFPSDGIIFVNLKELISGKSTFSFVLNWGHFKKRNILIQNDVHSWIIAIVLIHWCYWGLVLLQSQFGFDVGEDERIGHVCDRCAENTPRSRHHSPVSLCLAWCEAFDPSPWVVVQQVLAVLCLENWPTAGHWLHIDKEGRICLLLVVDLILEVRNTVIYFHIQGRFRRWNAVFVGVSWEVRNPFAEILLAVLHTFVEDNCESSHAYKFAFLALMIFDERLLKIDYVQFL